MEWATKRVLIAEDEDLNYMLLTEFLEPTGIQISRAKNGLEFLEIFKDYNPDIILLDLKMPHMNGYEVMEKLKELNNEIPVIVQTAYAMKSDIIKIKEAGCSDYISKPIEFEILIEKMGKFLNNL